jgi:hypothetical protein
MLEAKIVSEAQGLRPIMLKDNAFNWEERAHGARRRARLCPRLRDAARDQGLARREIRSGPAARDGQATCSGRPFRKSTAAPASAMSPTA